VALYRHSVTGRLLDSTSKLGYPWVNTESYEEASEPEEFVVRTADAILADVGSDPVLAAEALAAEEARDVPRKVLSARLRKIIADAEGSS
jgi:hypothetical protein